LASLKPGGLKVWSLVGATTTTTTTTSSTPQVRSVGTVVSCRKTVVSRVVKATPHPRPSAALVRGLETIEQSALGRIKAGEKLGKAFGRHEDFILKVLTETFTQEGDLPSSRAAAETIPLFMANSIRPSTASGYYLAMEKFVPWADHNGRKWNPPSSDTVLLYHGGRNWN
jgi:hypothetical protein